MTRVGRREGLMVFICKAEVVLKVQDWQLKAVLAVEVKDVAVTARRGLKGGILGVFGCRGQKGVRRL